MNVDRRPSSLLFFVSRRTLQQQTTVHIFVVTCSFKNSPGHILVFWRGVRAFLSV